MKDTLQLGIYASDAGGVLTVRLSLYVPCSVHGRDYLIKEVARGSLADAPSVWHWAESVLTQISADDLCCADGWTKGTALAVRAKETP